MLCDAIHRSEANIKVRFNTLIEQFKSNKRYLSLDDYTILEKSEYAVTSLKLNEMPKTN